MISYEVKEDIKSHANQGINSKRVAFWAYENRRYQNIKINNQYLMSFDDLKRRIGNKSVFNESE